MALTDIVYSDNFSALADRGNIGTLVDIDYTPTLADYVYRTEPPIANVQLGIVYGPQDTLTGTYSGSGSIIATDYAF